MSRIAIKRILNLLSFLTIVTFIIFWIKYTNYACKITGLLNDSEISSCETVGPFLTNSVLCNSNIGTYSGSMNSFIGNVTVSVICPFEPVELVISGYIMAILEINILVASVILANTVSAKWSKLSKYVGILKIWNTIYSGIIASLATAALCYNDNTNVSSIVNLESTQTHQILLLVMMYLICLFSLILSIEAFSKEKEAVFQPKLENPKIIQMTFEDMNNSSSMAKLINEHENLANAYVSS